MGGCPYSPGLPKNVAMEHVLYALHGSPYVVLDAQGEEVRVEEVAKVSERISGKLGRENASKAGRALLGASRKGIENEQLDIYDMHPRTVLCSPSCSAPEV